MATMNAGIRTKQNIIARYPLLSFFSLAIVFGWLSILPSLYFNVPFKPYQTIGAYGPLLAGVIVAAAEGNGSLKDLLRRIFNFRFGFGWYLFAFLFYVVVYLLTAGISGAPLIESLGKNWPMLFTIYLPALFTTHLVNAFGEESGWTAFAQARLQTRFNPTVAAVLLGALWAVWHLPAYFVPSEMGAFNPAIFVILVFQLVFFRIIWTWAANHARGSGIFATLLHASSNAVGIALIPQMFPPPTAEQMALFGMVLLGILLIIAALLVTLTRGRLGYRS